MSAFDIREKFIGFIKTASTANEEELKSLRRMVAAVVETIGAKNFVALTADILKKDLCIEGCNDMRQPLKRIFNISLKELRQDLSNDMYTGLGEHPIHLLSKEFIPAISNHIFRETHIFYPAALEFITDKGQWNDVKKGFGLIQIK